MAKGMYIGVGGVARKCKKTYIGIGGVARKIKKMYVGVAGVARLFFSGGVQKVSSVPQLPSGKGQEAIGVSGKVYALFAGYGYTYDVYAYSNSLSVTTLEQINDTYQRGLCAEKIGNYYLFAGGANGSSVATTRAVYYDEASLVKGNATNLSYAKWLASTASNGVYVVLAGGYPGTGNPLLSTEAYSQTLVRTLAPNMQGTSGRAGNKGCRVVNYALAPGGNSYGSSISWVCDAYDQSLVRYSAGVLSVARSGATAGNTDKYGFVIGSSSAGYSTKAVDVFDVNLVRTTLEDLPVSNTYPSAIGTGGYVTVDADYASGVVYQYDNNLVRIELEEATKNCYCRMSASVGSYIIFAGGSSVTTTSVDAYEF